MTKISILLVLLAISATFSYALFIDDDPIPIDDDPIEDDPIYNDPIDVDPIDDDHIEDEPIDSDDMSDYYTNALTPHTPNFLTGTWYGFETNPDQPLCCMPSGVVEIAANNATSVNLTASEWIGSDCDRSPNESLIIGWNSSASYSEVGCGEASQGESYCTNGLINTTHHWTANKTQVVVLSAEIIFPDESELTVGYCYFNMSKLTQVLEPVGSTLEASNYGITGMVMAVVSLFILANN